LLTAYSLRLRFSLSLSLTLRLKWFFKFETNWSFCSRSMWWLCKRQRWKGVIFILKLVLKENKCLASQRAEKPTTYNVSVFKVFVKNFLWFRAFRVTKKLFVFVKRFSFSYGVTVFLLCEQGFYFQEY
jgi:hypothetical protein